jgi:hypothetical protein
MSRGKVLFRLEDLRPFDNTARLLHAYEASLDILDSQPVEEAASSLRSLWEALAPRLVDPL